MSTKPAFEPRDPNYARRCRESLAHQPAMAEMLGAEMVDVQPGYTEITLPIRRHTLQQGGMVHGGLIGMLADSAAGYAALSLMAPGLDVVTVEYKINFLAPAVGDTLVGRGRVVRPGRTLFVCDADIYAVTDGKETHVARMATTMMAIPDNKQH